MMKSIAAAIGLAQAVQGLVPDSSSNASIYGRKLLERRELLQCADAYDKCGGKDSDGSMCCNEGLYCHETNEWYYQCRPVEESSQEDPPTPTPDPPAPDPPAADPPAADPPATAVVEEKSSSGCGEYAMCITGSSETYGPTVEQREWPDQGSAVTITSSGTCSWEEYAGGFDGYPSPVVGDGHEKGMDMAIEQMFPNNRDKQNKFLQAMIAIADPIDLDHPQDVARADGGERMNNIRKLNSACSELISICC